MAKSRKKIDPRQMGLFDLIREINDLRGERKGAGNRPGSLNIEAGLREMITQSLKRSRECRYGVAAEMSRLMGKEITKSQLDSWTAESKLKHRFPLAYLAAFIEATGDRSILHYLSEKCGGHFIEGEDALRLELGRIDEQKKELAKKEKLIRDFLRELK